MFSFFNVQESFLCLGNSSPGPINWFVLAICSCFKCYGYEFCIRSPLVPKDKQMRKSAQATWGLLCAFPFTMHWSGDIWELCWNTTTVQLCLFVHWSFSEMASKDPSGQSEFLFWNARKAELKIVWFLLRFFLLSKFVHLWRQQSRSCHTYFPRSGGLRNPLRRQNQVSGTTVKFSWTPILVTCCLPTNSDSKMLFGKVTAVFVKDLNLRKKSVPVEFDRHQKGEWETLPLGRREAFSSSWPMSARLQWESSLSGGMQQDWSEGKFSAFSRWHCLHVCISLVVSSMWQVAWCRWPLPPH